LSCCFIQCTALPANKQPGSVTDPKPVITSTKTLPNEPAEDNDGQLTPADLKIAAYSGIFNESVTQVDGLFKVGPFTENEPSRPVVEHINEAEIFTDRNNNGFVDAVVFLQERGGGS